MVVTVCAPMVVVMGVGVGVLMGVWVLMRVRAPVLIGMAVQVPLPGRLEFSCEV
jgi:hypothetical protein